MAWADEIATLNEKIAELQKLKDWINGVSREYSLGADIDGTVEFEVRTAAGRDGFFADWRTDNPTASESSTGLERATFTAWDDWNGTDYTSFDAEKNTELTNQINSLTTDRDDLQSKVDDGTIVDAGL
jgi:hypothetical protein